MTIEVPRFMMSRPAAPFPAAARRTGDCGVGVTGSTDELRSDTARLRRGVCRRIADRTERDRDVRSVCWTVSRGSRRGLAQAGCFSRLGWLHGSTYLTSCTPEVRLAAHV